MSKDDNYTNVILKDIKGKFEQILELMTTVAKDVDLKATQADVGAIKTDVKIIKAAVTDQSQVLSDHETRITSLETA